MKIGYRDHSGSQQIYVPDFRIRFKGGLFLGRYVSRPWIVETKCHEDLSSKRDLLIPKLRAGFRTAYEHRSVFHVVTEICLAGPPLENARFLRRYVNSEPAIDILATVLAQLRRVGRATVVEIAGSSQAMIHAVWYALARRLILADLEQLLSPKSQVWLA